MTTYKVEVDGEVMAADAGEAARKVSEHFAWIADQWETDETDWNTAPQSFLASTIDIRPI